jgi:hypothetical protein
LIYYNSHDRNSTIERAIFQICSIISITSGVFLGGLVALAVIAGATAVVCIEIIAAICVVISAGLVILALIEGANERAVRSLATQNDFII